MQGKPELCGEITRASEQNLFIIENLKEGK
jgi:hypothetical protein